MARHPFHLSIRASLLWAAFLAPGCGRDDEGALRVTQVVKGNGVVAGRVTYVGPPLVMKSLRNEPCCEGAKPITEETAIVDSAGGVQNVLLWIEGLPATDESQTPAPLLDQLDCRYTPHVVALTVGQSLVIRSSDATFHNVRYDPKNNPAKNFAMTYAGEELNVKFDKADLFSVRCDVHPWMLGYVGVFENRFYKISRTDGSFEIGGLPPGTYKLVAWHERFGSREVQVTTTEQRQTAAVDIVFQPTQ